MKIIGTCGRYQKSDALCIPAKVLDAYAKDWDDALSKTEFERGVSFVEQVPE